MPELPEVESVAADLRSALIGRSVQKVWHASMPNLLDAESLDLHLLKGETLQDIARKGKYMRWVTERYHMLVHLGMSGVFMLNGERSLHTHLVLEWSEKQTLCYTDPRRFGYFCLLPLHVAHARWEQLGVDALARNCSAHHLQKLAQQSRVAVKIWIMDQSKLAGVGNIYACEALFRAGIAPERPAGALNSAEWQLLVREIKAVMKASLRNRGTTFSNYRLTNGKGGAFQSFLQIFQKEGQSCPRCGALIQRQVQAGRSTFWCCACQH